MRTSLWTIFKNEGREMSHTRASFWGDMLLIFYEDQEPPRVPSLSLTQAPILTASTWR